MTTMTHDELVRAAARWLRKQRYAVVLEDVRTTCVNEQPDVIGWKNHGGSFVLECKTSLSDYRADAVKGFRRYPERGMGRLRAYVAPGTLAGRMADELRTLPSEDGRWGVYALGGPKEAPKVLLQPQPFPEFATNEEICLLVSSVRRVTEGWGRRMLGPDAPLNPNGDPHPTASKIIRDLMRDNANLRRQLKHSATSDRSDAP